jgi:hypothetical protein
MKNFSELLVTRPDLTVIIELRIHGRVSYQANINQHIVDIYSKKTFDLDSLLNFSIQLDDFDEGTSGIEIVEFSVDGLEILPLYRHVASPPTHYIDKLGIWNLNIPLPFYQWYHDISGQGWLLKPI